MGIFDWKHWLVLLVVAIVVFGSKRLKSLGEDLGESIRGFRRSLRDADEEVAAVAPPPPPPAIGSEVGERQERRERPASVGPG
ncbi:twin-arginine translocase TatA/TatE family subunit [Zestomonas carbonaria]|uniref:Sec-independent protein translocase protein TatA n=1 Tax=Zestomonas carbonaria TaxID=2762745 RepID=A0A7U7EP41_9GAMM|nr:twin-arginine translocase TatA/TatE family subunit [Pseudomonas carbonaria]CAD5108572.1 Sec-independent protein translocase protein TatA [Pseudomonas carbonaria]